MSSAPFPPEDPGQGTFLRRPSAHNRKFLPRPEAPPDESVILQRNVLRSAAAPAERQTDRRHVIAGDLPNWEPMPPGELFLTRPAAG